MENETQYVSRAQHEAAINLLKCQQIIYEKNARSSDAILEIRNLALARANADLNRHEIELLAKMEQDTQKLLTAQMVGNIATFHVGSDGSFVCSRNLSQMFLCEKPLKDFNKIFDYLHPLESEATKNFLLGDIQEQDGENRDIRFIAQDNSVRWLRWNIRKATGSADSFHGAVRDITKTRYLERRQRVTDTLRARQVIKLERLSKDLNDRSRMLAERVAELEALGSSLEDARNRSIKDDRAKSRFLAMMSHDIRTPMNAIMALLDLLLTYDLNSEHRRLLDLAQTSGDQMLFLLADIIEVARADGWELELEIHTIDLRDYLGKAVDAWRQLARKKGLEMQFITDDGLPHFIQVDKTRLRQLLDNLISNAIKYTAHGSITVAVDLVPRNGEPMLQIAVSDTGHGIEPFQLEHLFQAGNRIANPLDPDVEGSGLGLAICHRITTAMGGIVDVESAVGLGSTFKIIIPCHVAEGDISTIDTRVIAQTKVTRKNGQALHLLVAEDVASNQQVIAAVLDQLGCTYNLVGDGVKALAALDEHFYDAILMDVSMPRMDGIEATRNIRARKNEIAKIPVIGVTAFIADAERAAMLNAGMNVVIAKPLRLDVMRETLERVAKPTPSAFIPSVNSDVPVPYFDDAKLIDEDVLYRQLFSVPERSRPKLCETLSDDLTKWHHRFESAYLAGDTVGVARARHALKGICAGFGLTLLTKFIEDLADTPYSGGKDVLDNLHATLAATLAEFNMLSQRTERRRAWLTLINRPPFQSKQREWF